MTVRIPMSEDNRGWRYGFPSGTPVFAGRPLGRKRCVAGHGVRGSAKLLATLALLTAIPAKAQIAPGITVDAPDEKIEVSPKQQQQMPKITLAARRDTIMAGLESVFLTATREGPLGDARTVTVQLAQEQSWLSETSYEVTFAADDADTLLVLPLNEFSSSVVESGNLTAAVDSVDGYDTDEATATVFVISQEGPAVTVSLTHSSYLFGEHETDAEVIVTARMAAGMPRGASVVVSVSDEGGSESRPELSASSGVDYWSFITQPSLRESNFALEDGRWVARQALSVTLVDDDIREGRESFQVHLQHATGRENEIRLLNPDMTACSGADDCRYMTFIDDDEDIPALDLSVSEDEIDEEEEGSSTATVSITNGKTFAAAQTVTFAFAGTATGGTDYTVAPADGDRVASGHQVIMLPDSKSARVTLSAVDDDFEDGNETIEVSATHAGNAVGNTHTIRILNHETLPKITLAADRDTIIAGLETVVLRATREAPLDDPLAVTLQVAQDQSWLSRTSFQLNFAARGSAASLQLSRALFSPDVMESGTLTATIDTVSGYDTGDATATVHVVSQEGPAIRVSFAEASYRFAEDEEDASIGFVARAAAGMPRGTSVRFTASTRSGTAGSPGDYQAVSATVSVSEADFTLLDGVWEARHELPLTLIDDDVFEGTESFVLILEMTPGMPSEVQLSDIHGSPCQDDCRTPVEITDEGDSPAFELSLSDDEIREEGETSSTATLSITNGKTFSDNQVVTLQLGGDAIPGHDYSVAPADADDNASGHQMALTAGSASAAATFTAIGDEREEGDEQIRISVNHGGDAVAGGTIRLVDRFPGPRVEITFEGVQPPRDDYDDGVATGPFTARIRFSEPVEGFTQDDIEWQTHYLTTVDTTVIAVLLWDYTEVRPGLEYTARMMPDQNGRLHVLVRRGGARSVATSDPNQLGHGSLQVELPPNRMMVEPRALNVAEGDEKGAHFMVLLTSAPTGAVTATVSGTQGTDVAVDRPAWTFQLPYWNGGWWVKVTAKDDEDGRDERVTLTVRASGGGYDGRIASVVVNVGDDDGSGVDVDDEAGALRLLQGLTPEEAAAALFGEGDLSPARLDALDRLGNRNGSYDLGDLLSWVERCRRGEVDCGSTPAPVTVPLFGMGALLSGGALARRRVREIRAISGSSRSVPRRGPDAFGRPPALPASWRGMALWYALVVLLGAALLWGCADRDDLVRPVSLEPDPGFLTVQLTAPPAARDIGALVVVEGPAIETVRAPGFEMFQSESAVSPRQIVVAGTLATGPIAEFLVPDRALLPRYRARLIEVTGENYSPRDLSEYEVVITR